MILSESGLPGGPTSSPAEKAQVCTRRTRRGEGVWLAEPDEDGHGRRGPGLAAADTIFAVGNAEVAALRPRGQAAVAAHCASKGGST